MFLPFITCLFWQQLVFSVVGHVLRMRNVNMHIQNSMQKRAIFLFLIRLFNFFLFDTCSASLFLLKKEKQRVNCAKVWQDYD